MCGCHTAFLEGVQLSGDIATAYVCVWHTCMISYFGLALGNEAADLGHVNKGACQQFICVACPMHDVISPLLKMQPCPD